MAMSGSEGPIVFWGIDIDSLSCDAVLIDAGGRVV
jgi:hypothetical protein